MVLYWMLIFSLFSTLYGQDVAFQYNSACYSVGNDMTLTAEYTGSGTVTAIQWYYSGQSASNLFVVASTCQAVTPIDAGYPSASRMSFECDLPTNTFKLILTELKEEEVEKTWGATFSVSVGPSPTVEQLQITVCQSTSASTTTPTKTTTSSSASTSSTSTSTPKTPISTSSSSAQTSTSTSTLNSASITHTIPITSSRILSTTSTTSSSKKAKSSTVSPSNDSSSSETVVIIVASVVGGLFLVGIVIIVTLMLISQRKKRKHVSKGIQAYEEDRNNSFEHYNYGYTFNRKSSGHQFKQNPLFIRQSNRPVTYQYQSWNGNYRQNPYSLTYIYPGFTDEDQYSGRYAGQDRRRNEGLNCYNSYYLRPHYRHPPNPQRSNSRMPVGETLHTDDQNCVVQWNF